MVFGEAVRASDGFIYDKAMLLQLLKNKQRSPMTREVLKPEYCQASEKNAEVLRFRHKRSEDLIKFALQARGQQPQMATTALEHAVDYLAVVRTEEARSLSKKAASAYAQLGRRIPDALHRICQ
jgi:hypothetical protein